MSSRNEQDWDVEYGVSARRLDCATQEYEVSKETRLTTLCRYRHRPTGANARSGSHQRRLKRGCV